MSYPTLPFALVYHLANITPERATLGSGRRMVGIHAHHDRSIRSVRVEITSDSELPNIEAAVARIFAEGPVDTLTLTHTMTDDRREDIGIIIERGRDPMIFAWQWAPAFGITLIEGENADRDIDTWSGVRLAKDLLAR